MVDRSTLMSSRLKIGLRRRKLLKLLGAVYERSERALLTDSMSLHHRRSDPRPSQQQTMLKRALPKTKGSTKLDGQTMSLKMPGLKGRSGGQIELKIREYPSRTQAPPLAMELCHDIRKRASWASRGSGTLSIPSQGNVQRRSLLKISVGWTMTSS